MSLRVVAADLENPAHAEALVEIIESYAKGPGGQGRPIVNIHDLAVLPEQRGRGAGRALLREVERRARERGCARITLEAHDTNQGAKRLYRSFGFGPWDPPTLFVTKPLP